MRRTFEVVTVFPLSWFPKTSCLQLRSPASTIFFFILRSFRRPSPFFIRFVCAFPITLFSRRCRSFPPRFLADLFCCISLFVRWSSPEDGVFTWAETHFSTRFSPSFSRFRFSVVSTPSRADPPSLRAKIRYQFEELFLYEGLPPY